MSYKIVPAAGVGSPDGKADVRDVPEGKWDEPGKRWSRGGKWLVIREGLFGDTVVGVYDFKAQAMTAMKGMRKADRGR